MKEYNITVTTKDADIVPDIMRMLSRYDCDIHVDKATKGQRYSGKYETISFSRLGERFSSKADGYKEDILFYKHVRAALESYGLSPKHKGFKYSAECIKIIIMFENDTYSLNKDVYPIVSEMYSVTPTCIEHNVRNAIICAWENLNANDEEKSKISTFGSRPTNMRFLDHLAKITNYSLMDVSS